MKHIVWIICLWLLASCSESREEAMLLRKNLTVYCNAEDSPLKLTVLGMVE